jgi:hypothetical protein
MATMNDLFLAHVGPSLAKHLALLQATEGLSSEIDLDEGVVTFGDRLRFEIQWLGSEDEESKSWTWGWAQRPALPKTLVGTSLELKAYGRRERLDVFTRPRFTLDGLTGDTLAILACGLAASESFFIADTEAGTTFFLIPDLKGQIPRDTSPHFVAKVVTEMLDTYEIQEPREALRPYLIYEGYRIDEKTDREWVALHPEGHRLGLSFDSLGRLVRLSAKDD